MGAELSKWGWVGGGGGGRRVDLLVVDVPVIISDKFQQSIVYEDVELQIQFIDRVVDFSVVLQRRVPAVQTVQKTGEIPQLQFLDKVDDARCCMTTGAGLTEQKTVEVPQLQCSEQGGRCPCCAGRRAG